MTFLRLSLSVGLAVLLVACGGNTDNSSNNSEVKQLPNTKPQPSTLDFRAPEVQAYLTALCPKAYNGFKQGSEALDAIVDCYAMLAKSTGSTNRAVQTRVLTDVAAGADMVTMALNAAAMMNHEVNYHTFTICDNLSFAAYEKVSCLSYFLDPTHAANLAVWAPVCSQPMIRPLYISWERGPLNGGMRDCLERGPKM